jgi:uncharacterized protein
MQSLPTHLKQLDQRLLAMPEGVMLLSELDGFFAGLLVCPDLIHPSEWLPLVLSPHDRDDDAAPFGSLEEGQALLDLITKHYNDVALALQRGPGSYMPIFDADREQGETFWELWADGFGQAVALRHEIWSAVLESGDDDARAALMGLFILVGLATEVSDDAGLDQAERDELSAEAPDLIPYWVETLYGWRSRHKRENTPATGAGPRSKIARNAPCPCGSGRKYKKCCGLN